MFSIKFQHHIIVYLTPICEIEKINYKISKIKTRYLSQTKTTENCSGALPPKKIFYDRNHIT